MLRVLFELWPLTLPTAIYLLWYFFHFYRKKMRGEIHHPLKEGPWLRIFIITIFVAVITVVTLGFLNSDSISGKYQPAQLKNGQVSDGKVIP